MTDPTRQVVGFDRFIRLAWLEEAADGVARGLGASDLRDALDSVLDGQVAGTDIHSARGKTKTVLLRVWLLVPEHLRPLRDDALRLLPGQDDAHRLALHWGMTVTAYRFFFDVAAAVGRLDDLQGVVPRSQVRRRVAELWGERTTIQRALPRALATLLDWGVLRSTELRDVFRSREPVTLTDPAVQRWLTEAVFLARGGRSAPLVELLRSPALFPFRMSLVAYELRQHPRLELTRLGLDDDVVVRRESGPILAGQRALA